MCNRAGALWTGELQFRKNLTRQQFILESLAIGEHEVFNEFSIIWWQRIDSLPFDIQVPEVVMEIHVLSPYVRQHAYPSFWRLLNRLEVEGVRVYNPIMERKPSRFSWLYSTKLKHILPLYWSCVKSLASREKPRCVVTFGIFQAPLVFFIKLIYPRATVITYQPELHEFNSGVLTFLFRASVGRYDLFIDVNEIRLTLRRRYFKKIPKSIVLENFDHEVDEAKFVELKMKKFVYAGFLDSEESLLEFCDQKNIDLRDVDCYITTIGNKKVSGVLNCLSAKPFREIAKGNYHFGIICYPFQNRIRRHLNNKYCAPSKLFSYLGAGIIPLHYDHPTLRKYVRAGLSSESTKNAPMLSQRELAIVRSLFSVAKAKVSCAERIIEGSISGGAELADWEEYHKQSQLFKENLCGGAQDD